MKIGWVDSHGFKSIGEREKKGREKTACENMEYNVKYEHKFQTKGAQQELGTMGHELKNVYTLKDVIEASIKTDLKKIKHYKAILKGMKIEGRLKCHKSANGNTLCYYYVSPSGDKEVYLGRSKRRTIKAMQKKRLAEEMIKVLENNIKVKDIFCETYMDDTIGTVINSLPLAYRNIAEWKGNLLGTQRYAEQNKLCREGHRKRNSI